MKLVNRKDEINILQQMLDSDMPEFLALFGRRRVGKTFLIKQFFCDKDVIFFNVTGAKDGAMHEQISHFTQRMAEAFYAGMELKAGKNWDEVFRKLTQTISLQAPKDKKIILFFDELPWMATKRSRLLQNLDYYWNQYWSDDVRIKLIVCGSSASWILNKIIRNKGGLYNRITKKIHLEPFNLPETKRFLANIGIHLSNKQILLLYMVTGGIPYYLNRVEKNYTATQLIEKMAFSKKAFLLEEFNNLFGSLFDDDDIYTEIVRTIAQHRYGVGQQQLLEKLGTHAKGGFCAKKLQNLEDAGFIMSFTPLYHKRKGIYYRIVDEYTLFYLKWLEPLRKSLHKQALSKGNWQAMQNTPEWNNWLGYTFEAVCYKHLPIIREKLEISPTAIADTWRYVPRKHSKERGAQIDLLFDRRDDAITLCEIKYSAKPYLVTKDYVEVLKRKMEVFQKRTRTKKQLFIALVSAAGLKNNYYAEDLLSGVVTLDDLFER
jgi:uncharacterized protein